MRKKRKLHLPQSKLLEERREREEKKQTFKSSFTTKKQKKNIHTLARKISKLALLKNNATSVTFIIKIWLSKAKSLNSILVKLAHK